MKRLIAIAIAGVLLSQCKEDDKKPDTTHKTTPYEIVMPPGLPVANLPQDNMPTVEGVALGRALFYEPMLSSTNTQSCGSCHNQGFAFTDNGKKLSIGVQQLEGKRNSMPIFNMMFHLNGFFWDGRAPLLRDQALMPIQDELEMNESLANVVTKLGKDVSYREMFRKAFGTDEITPQKIGLAMEQFMLTMVSGLSKFDMVQLGQAKFTSEEERGRKLFFTEFNPASGLNGADCFHCHGGPNFTNNLYMNNGLDAVGNDPGRYKVTGKDQDYARFKTPSLRNIEFSAPYMHDGRFATLQEVIEHYNSGVKDSPNLDPNMHAIKDGLKLTAGDKSDLISFLKTLTDTAFMNNPAFSSPR